MSRARPSSRSGSYTVAMRLSAFGFAIVVAGCIRSSSTTCGDNVCAAGTSCTSIEQQSYCVTVDQRAACAVLVEGSPCTADHASLGTCYGGACLPLPTCTYPGEVITVPVFNATTLDQASDVSHANDPVVGFGANKGILFWVPTASSEIVSISVQLPPPDLDACGEGCLLGGELVAHLVRPDWTSEATWSLRAPGKPWAMAGIGDTDRTSPRARFQYRGADNGEVILIEGDRPLIWGDRLTVWLTGGTPAATAAFRDPLTSFVVRLACVRARTCGDGVREQNEECDDGNFVDGDRCSSTCQFERCGNGMIDSGEECDDANAIDSDSCAACKFARCGDGFVQTTGEECDLGAANGTGCCTLNCTTTPPGSPCP